jgi:A/G-specific adenine glycosylase
MQTVGAPELAPRVSLQTLDAVVRRLLSWYSRAARDLPWRRTRNPYAIWISEVMLQQTQVQTVIPYWTRWMKRFPDPAALARARTDAILKYWEGLGYYSRARNLHAAARILVSRHRSLFPSDASDIEALPGVGRYTAGAVRSIAFNQPAPIVDGNVVRTLARLFGCRANPREAKGSEWFWMRAEALVTRASHRHGENPQSCGHFNQALMELGATVCTPRQPDCARCPLRTLCEAHRHRWVDLLPIRVPRARTVRRRMTAFLVEVDGRFLVRRRPADGVNGLLWEIPSVVLAKGQTVAGAAECSGLRLTRSDSKPWFELHHTITHHRIRLQVYRAIPRRNGAGRIRGGVWRSLSEIRGLAMPSAHRRIFHQFAGR